MKFKCSYAYDVSCYYDFVVEAKDEAEAERKIQGALKKGVFDSVTADPCWDNGSENRRAFVSEQIPLKDAEGHHHLKRGKLV